MGATRREVLDDLPPNPPTLSRGRRANDPGPPAVLLARDPTTGLAARHPTAPRRFPTMDAAEAYAEAHSAGPPSVHWATYTEDEVSAMLLVSYPAVCAARGASAN